MEIKELDLKLKEGHAVCFDFDGVIHKYSKGWQDARGCKIENRICQDYGKQTMYDIYEEE